MCVDDSKEGTMSVWDWDRNDLLGRVAIDHQITNGGVFHPLDNNLIITFGKNHLVFWNKRRDGYFDRSGKKLLWQLKFCVQPKLISNVVHK